MSRVLVCFGVSTSEWNVTERYEDVLSEHSVALLEHLICKFCKCNTS
jgi:hypothetical protein